LKPPIINPDGSAKIQMTWRGEGMGISNVANFSQGVEAWSDLKVEREDSEISKMTLTAYVPDITSCKIRISGGEERGTPQKVNHSSQSRTLMTQPLSDDEP
jgi:hypothetical protein